MTLYLLNLADLALTLHAISHGGVELNPLMQSVPVMVLYKTVGVGVLCYLLEMIASDKRLNATVRFNTRKIARRGLRVCTGVYSVLFLYHLYFILGGI